MTERRRNKMLSVLASRRDDLAVVLEDIHDPHNVSAILRSADATGLMDIHLVYTKEEFPRLGKKSSASAVKWVARHRFRSISECYAELRRRGFSIYATHLGTRARSLYELDLTRKVALVFGNEHRGVSEEAAREADENFQIPQRGMIQSLNVSVACAVSLYEAFRQRCTAGLVGNLTPDAQEALFNEWAGRGMRRPRKQGPPG